MTAVWVYAAIAVISLIVGPFFLPPTSWAPTTGERLMVVGFLALGWPLVFPLLVLGRLSRRDKAVVPKPEATKPRRRDRLAVLAGD